MANDQTAQTARITPRELAKGFSLLTGERHRFVQQRYEGHVLDFEDIHFHLESVVMLPDFGADEPVAGSADAGRVTGLAALCAVYLHVEAQPQRAVLVVGHSDRSVPVNHSLEMSELRGANVLALLEGNRHLWVDICQRRHKVEDYQTILKWVHRTWGWGCDPGPVDNVLGPTTRRATEAFQSLYNRGAAGLPLGFGASITVDGTVGQQTWGAFFDVYMRVLEQLLGTDSAGLDARRKSLRFVDPHKAVGCGEYHPLTDNVVANRTSQIDRRVEVLFFDPGEEPRLDCHPRPGVCDRDACDLYDRRRYLLRPIQATPETVRLADYERLQTHLDADRDDEVDEERQEPADNVTEGDLSVVELNLFNIDNGALQFLSLSPHGYYGGYTRIHGTINVEGDEDDRLTELVLQVLEGGEVVATALLAEDARDELLTEFGSDRMVTIACRQLLFELPSAEAADVNQHRDGTVELWAVARSARAPEARRRVGVVQKLVRFTGENRFGGRDVGNCIGTNHPCGGDDWVKPSVNTVIQHYSRLHAADHGLVWNDFSKMNGGPFPPHQSHQTGNDVDGFFNGYGARNAAVAERLLGYLNDLPIGSRIERVYVDFQQRADDPFWQAIRYVTLDDDRLARNVIHPVPGHDTHFHWRVTNPR